MTPTDFNIAISSAGRRVALLGLFRRTLTEMGLTGAVIATEASPLSSAFQSADDGFLVPQCSDPEFIPTMLEICKEQQIKLLVPTIDPELPVYARNRARFEDIGTTIAVSSPEVIAIGSDKSRTHAWLTQEGFPTVRQTSGETFSSDEQDWSYPLLVKPRYGSSSIGVAVVNDFRQFDAATRGDDFVVESIAPGDEYTLDVLTDRSGRCGCAVPRRRIEVRAGEVSKGVTVRSNELIELAQKMCDRLPGAYGPLNIQMFLDPKTGEVNVIEVNPRFGGGFPLSWQAGAKYPQWLIEESLGKPSSVSAESWQEGVVMLRWDEAVFTTADRVGIR